MTPKISSVADWTILIVDDTPDNLIVAKTVLQYHGAKVHTATNGEEGLELLKTLRPTAILLDIRMPRMDGWAMFELVRKDPEIAHIPIIAITAYAMEGDREEILDTGFDGYISKPFEISKFVHQIEDFIVQSIERKHKSEDASA